MTIETKPSLRRRAQAVEQPQSKQLEQFQGLHSVREFLDGMKGEFAKALPRHLTADRLIRITLTEVNRVPLLAQCTVESFGGSLMTAATLGLEPGVGGECWLIPYKNGRTGRYEVQLVIGYQGMVKLFWQHPLARSIDAHAVYSEDRFDFAYGLVPKLEHRPSLNRAQESRPYAYYAVATTTTVGSAFVVMSIADVEAVRARAKAKDDGPWMTDYEAMARKTCVRRLFKLLPKSAILIQAIEHDDRDEGIVPGFATAMVSPVTRPALEGELATGDDEYSPPAESLGDRDEAVQPIDVLAGDGGTDPAVVDVPAPSPLDMITPPQRAKMLALFNELGIKDRGERLATSAAIIDRKVESANQLTKNEASVLIDTLEQVSMDDDPAAALRLLLKLLPKLEEGRA